MNAWFGLPNIFSRAPAHVIKGWDIISVALSLQFLLRFVACTCNCKYSSYSLIDTTLLTGFIINVLSYANLIPLPRRKLISGSDISKVRKGLSNDNVEFL